MPPAERDRRTAALWIIKALASIHAKGYIATLPFELTERGGSASDLLPKIPLLSSTELLSFLAACGCPLVEREGIALLIDAELELMGAYDQPISLT